MPHITKSNQDLQAQAVLAWRSRNSSTSWNVTWPSTLSQTSIFSVQTTPAVSPTPPDIPDVNSDEESNEVQEISEESYLYLPDIHILAEDISPEALEEEEGYHTDDDLSEMEDGELEESLKKQKEGKGEPAMEIAQETRDAFHTLMRDVSQRAWRKLKYRLRSLAVINSYLTIEFMRLLLAHLIRYTLFSNIRCWR